MTKASTTPGFLLLLAATASLLLALIIAPFAGALFAAAVLAGVLHPVQAWLESKLGDRPALAAGSLTLGVTTIVVVPLAALCVFVAQQITVLYSNIASILDNEGVEGLIRQVPGPVQGIVRDVMGLITEHTPAAEGSLTQALPAAAADDVEISGGDLETAAGIATEVFNGLASLLVDLGVLVLALFFLLSQGSRLVSWIVDALPLSEDQGTKLVEEFRDVTRAVFAATVVTAVIQTVVAAIGYWIAAIPYMPVALLLTFVAALVPVVGAAAVVGVIGILLMLDGELGYGVFLLLWGILPVGICDNIAKPWLARGKLRLPGSVVLFAMLGGVAVFGPMGVVAGPLIVAFFLASLRLLRQEGLVAS